MLSVFSNTKNYEKRFNTNYNFSVDIENDKIESKLLKSFGITEKDKFVCIHVRDNLYYDDKIEDLMK